ncbi:caspase family protein [Dyadobacter sp. CY261]|uniref:caspase family protein n=1 Tax=Dyadobacter sp. CY261 TaxID=2907203 RepID=UPI001F2507D3|nr:caspase family protein [Dyadobacter sp. CY261]MCF0069319.1 caspase family protein [Dyadobacter sp. CY261]
MKIFALLIGINEYSPSSSPSIRALNGCVNDVADFGKFLTENYGDLIPDSKQVLVLTNADASRANVVKGFREHLAQAGPDDIAVVYYSGHGSTGITAAEFQAETIDGEEQTWVLYDSREPGKYDLADKEIALLLEEVSAKNPKIVVIADSCHSGSVTREVEQFLQMQARFEKGTTETRNLGSYLDGAYLRRGNLKVPSSDHLLLAACDRIERAWESNGHGQFTQSLISVLSKSGGQVTYADLFVQVRAFIKEALKNQTPQMEALGIFDLRQGFLGRNVESGRLGRYRVYQKANNKWTIDLGAGMGIEEKVGEPIEVKIYDSVVEGQLVGEASLDAVNVTESTLHTGALPLDAGKTYWGEPEFLRLSPFFVYGDDAVKQVMNDTVTAASESGVLLTDIPQAALFELKIENGNVAIYKTANRERVQTVAGTDKFSTAQVLNVLQTLARWQRLMDLHNKQSGIRPDQIKFEVEVSEGAQTNAFEGPLITLDHDGTNIPFKVNFTNNATQKLYVSLLYLSPDYGVIVIFRDAQPVPQGGSVVLTNDVFTLNSEEEIDTLKLIVSTEAIDSSLFVQQPLQIGAVVTPSAGRGLLQAKGVGATKSDWLTKAVTIRLVKKAEKEVGAQPLVIGGGVTIEPHPSFRGKLGWTPLVSGTRGVDRPGINEAYATNPWFQIVDFEEGAKGESRSVAEVVDIRNTSDLKDEPLVINIKPENDEEIVLPFFFDGEDFVPMGIISINDPGLLQVQIHSIPEEISEKTRSLGGAFRMVFLKFAAKLGVKTDPNQLRWVDYDDEATRKDEGLASRVQQAKNVLLLVHGIIGDTEDMAKTFKIAFDSGYDLVLTYDYENLNTPIEEIAGILKDKLTNLGFGENDDKKLVLVAHSMGGLVSRYLIEDLGGSQFIDKLIMAGTPNGGSKFGKIPGYVSWTSVALALGTKFFPPQVGAVTGFLSSVLKMGNKQVLYTLEQMDSGSEFIKKLNQKNVAPIPYFIVGGDLEAYLTANGGLPLMEKVVGQIGTWVYRDTINDIAVSIESIFDAHTADKPQKISCHHLNYFVNDDAVSALAKLL